ncbi:metallophosphoesterase domain-containing protein 1 isoform X1 [Neopsephotus bourkii]|uniref:metallophosphoesterase domain-containing protein 1 isoform X1 n=1 Tax=Neopsephotus bourkii TaxID=309878 RepID=UPI002AA55514|nr:metallophosphoesterase domain-containing protein 1 isoform X1 [Neopsephotus bourkii]
MILSWPDFEAKESCACSVPLRNTTGAGRKGAFPLDTSDAPLCPTATSHRIGPRQPPGTAEGTPSGFSGPESLPGEENFSRGGDKSFGTGGRLALTPALARPPALLTVAFPPNGQRSAAGPARTQKPREPCSQTSPRLLRGEGGATGHGRPGCLPSPPESPARSCCLSPYTQKRPPGCCLNSAPGPSYRGLGAQSSPPAGGGTAPPPADPHPRREGANPCLRRSAGQQRFPVPVRGYGVRRAPYPARPWPRAAQLRRRGARPAGGAPRPAGRGGGRAGSGGFLAPQRRRGRGGRGEGRLGSRRRRRSLAQNPASSKQPRRAGYAPSLQSAFRFFEGECAD